MHQPHEIEVYPDSLDRFTPTKKGMTQRADDKVFLESHASRLKVDIIFGGGLFL